MVAPDGDAVFDAKVYSSDPAQPKLVTRNDAARLAASGWTAPKAGTGPLTVYVAAVDGNGGGGDADNDQDPYDDDTVVGELLPPGGERAGAQLRVGGLRDGRVAGVVALAVAGAAARRRAGAR